MFGIKVWQQECGGVLLGCAGGHISLLFKQPKWMMGNTTKGPSAPCRRQDQDPEAPRAGPMFPQSQLSAQPEDTPELCCLWLFEKPHAFGSFTQTCQTVLSLAFLSCLSLLLLPFPQAAPQSSLSPLTAPSAEPHHSSSISCQNHCLAALAKQQLPAS